jgi:hypothetical protein
MSPCRIARPPQLEEASSDFQRAKSRRFSVTSVASARAASSAINRSRCGRGGARYRSQPTRPRAGMKSDPRRDAPGTARQTAAFPGDHGRRRRVQPRPRHSGWCARRSERRRRARHGRRRDCSECRCLSNRSRPGGSELIGPSRRRARRHLPVLRVCAGREVPGHRLPPPGVH